MSWAVDVSMKKGKETFKAGKELGRNESQQISGKMCKGKSAKKKFEMISWNIYTNLRIQEAQEVLNEKDMCTL